MNSKLCVPYFLILFSINAFSQEEVSEQEFRDGTIIVFAHQDDDLLWMLPFWSYAEKMIMAAYPCPPTLRRVVEKHGEEYSKKWSAALTHSKGDNFTDCDFHNLYLNETQPYILDIEAVRNYLDPIINDNKVKRIITHNYWGEYGNRHHKQIFEVVRQLAVECKKDVWVIGIKAILPEDSNPVAYGDVVLNNLPTFTTRINSTEFKRFRQIYLETEWPDGLYCDRNRATWTWDESYPGRPLTYIKIVDQGVSAALSPGLSRMSSFRTGYNCYCQD